MFIVELLPKPEQSPLNVLVRGALMPHDVAISQQSILQIHILCLGVQKVDKLIHVQAGSPLDLRVETVVPALHIDVGPHRLHEDAR